jgi:ABC-2 type transport system permease protein
MNRTLPLAKALAKGFLRDRQAVFFSILFPLMFLFLFGTIFANPSTDKSKLVLIDKVPLIQQLPASAKTAFDTQFSVTNSTDRDAAIKKVRDGDADGALEQVGDKLVLHFSRADAVKAATVQGTLASFVDNANISATGEKPKFAFDAQQVEDESLKGIQYVAPGLLGWAVASSATFGAAMTLVTWRQSELLRRLRLSPTAGAAIVAARLMVSVGVALLQTAIFLVLSTLIFGLKLTGAWYWSIPLIVAATVTFMAIGMFCGAVAKTNEGATGLANIFVLPMAFLSGSFIPLDAAPTWLKTVSKIFPLRYLNDGMLDVMVRGKGAGAIVVPLLVLLGFAAVIGGLSSRLIRWDRA